MLYSSAKADWRHYQNLNLVHRTEFTYWIASIYKSVIYYHLRLKRVFCQLSLNLRSNPLRGQ